MSEPVAASTPANDAQILASFQGPQTTTFTPVAPAAPAAPADDDGDDDGDSSELGDAGKQALDRMKARLRQERSRRLAAEQQVAAALATDDAGRIRAEAEAAATEKANARILRAEIRAVATGKLVDPADALAFLDLTQFHVDEDGSVDLDEIKQAIDDLLKTKSHLAAQGGGTRSLRPDPSQGGAKAAPASTADQFAAAIQNAF
jgi:hypothetical protein